MAQTNVEMNTFVRGLITEASPLTFPENASLDEQNFVLNRDGSRQRRLGMDYESTFAVVDALKDALTFDNHRLSTFAWENVNNDPALSLGVIQVGNNLWFVDLGEDTLSTNLKNQGAPLVLGISGNKPIQFAALSGVLICVSEELANPIYIEYNASTDTITQTTIQLQIRDLFGVDDTLSVDTRPATLSNLHQYNLLNQGWFTDNATAVFNDKGVYPSNADIQTNGKDSTDDFDPDILFKQFFGNTPAPKGKFIIDVFDRGASREAQTPVSGLPQDKSVGSGVTTVASYASRIFYSGANPTVQDGDERSPEYATFIFFTQLIDNKSKFGNCYQEADPTSEVISDLVATDGGTIQIPEARNILKLVTKDTSLVVIAENGVWEITGPDGVFKADSFSVSQVTNIGAVSASSVVNAEGTILYWGQGGIYQLASDQVSGRLQAVNITETTIQTRYNEISGVAREFVDSNYDPASRKISWLYNDTAGYDGILRVDRYNKELVLDTVLGAFYTNDIGEITNDTPYVAGYMPTPNFLSTSFSQAVVVNGEQVQVNGEDVVVTQTARGRGNSQTKYLTIRPNVSGSNYGFTFSHYINPNFLDWESADNVGVDAAAFLITGYALFNDSQRSKQVNYLTAHFNRTETTFQTDGLGLTPDNQSSCLVQVQWGFANSAVSGKFGTQFQAYRLGRFYLPANAGDDFDYGFAVISTKNRLRGSGRAISIRFDTEAGKDVHLLGWGMSLEGRRNV